jgi:hypothetical protein
MTRTMMTPGSRCAQFLLRFMSWWTAYSERATRDMLTAAIANVWVSEEEKMISWGSAKEYICDERCANCRSSSTRCETKIGSEGSHPRVQVESGPRPALAQKV